MPEENIPQPPSILGSEGQEQNMPQPPPDAPPPPPEEVQENIPISNEDFFNTMDIELNREVKYDEDTMAALTNKFTNMKDQYADGDKADQALLEADVIQTGDRMVKAEEFKKHLASLCALGSGIGHNPTEKFAEYTDDIVNIVNGNNEVTYDGNMPGYELHDGWKSMEEIEKLAKGRYVDETSSNILSTYIQDQELLASEIQPGEDPTFNWQKNYNKVKNHIIETGDIRSLATDKIFGNRVFKDDLSLAIEMGTYANMGLTEQQVNQMDPTPDGKITTEDAAQITSNILQDEDLLKEYLTDYYTKAIEQNFYNNLNQDVRKTWETKKQADKHAFTQTPTGLLSRPSFKNDIPIKGGVIRNGIFMPDKK